MSAAIDHTKPVIQPSINYFDTKIVGKNTKRWVFFPGDVIVARRKSEIEWLRPGGEETTSPCLQKYGRGFIPRGFASLLELGGDLMPIEHLGELRNQAWNGMQLNEELVRSRLVFMPVYPGDALNNLRAHSMNDGGIRKGLDEIRALQGREWGECKSPEGTGILDILEKAMYGDGMEPSLRGLREQIAHVKVNLPTLDLGLFKEDALRMCDEFRLWAENKMNLEHTNLKQGVHTGGHVYTYSPLAELLIPQLEIVRQDQPFAELAKLNKDLAQSIVNSQPAQSQGMSAADMELFERKMDERLAAARAADAQRIAELEAKLAQPEAPKTYICEHCGEEVKLNAKGFHVGRNCKVLHPKSE